MEGFGGIRVGRDLLEQPRNLHRSCLDFDEPFEPRLAELTGDPNISVELEVGQLVVDHLEIFRLDLDVDRADRPLVHGNRSADGHHLLVLVDNPHLADGDGFVLQIDAGIEAGVCGAQLGNLERAAADVDDAVEMRIVCRSRSP